MWLVLLRCHKLSSLLKIILYYLLWFASGYLGLLDFWGWWGYTLPLSIILLGLVLYCFIYSFVFTYSLLYFLDYFFQFFLFSISDSFVVFVPLIICLDSFSRRISDFGWPLCWSNSCALQFYVDCLIFSFISFIWYLFHLPVI